MATRRRPDFLIIGAPKAGTSALHAVLARHPQLYLSSVKEPKFYLCGGRPPTWHTQRGPGDAHSAREWVWNADDYGALFAGARPDQLCGESSALYLWDRRAHVRIRHDAPNVKLIAVLRDPVDRAYSNWQHLFSDGLEPIPDFVEACDAEEDRARRGYAAFWRYRGLGRYGEQLEHLFGVFERSRVHVIRYRDLLDEPEPTLAGICGFLGVESSIEASPQPENVRPLAPDDALTRVISQSVRYGAAAGAFLPPQWWRRASSPLVRALHRRGTVRPTLTADQRRRVLEPMIDDIGRLEWVLGARFDHWLGDSSRGAFEAPRPGLPA